MLRFKLINFQALLEFLCCFFFGALILYLVLSQKYLFYVTPRMKPYLYFTAIIMFLWGLSSLPKLLTFKYKIRSSHCFVLAIPALLIMLPHSQLKSSDIDSYGNSGIASFSDASKQNTNASSENLQSISSESPDYTETTDNSEALETENSSDTSYSEADVYSPKLGGLDTENKKIVISDEEYGMWMTEIYSNMYSYDGYSIELTGFVYKDEGFLENEFSPSRLMMTCCTADLTPAGLLCKYDKANELEENSWVKVTGNIFIGSYEYEGSTYYEPEINLAGIEEAEEVPGYVYPY